MDAWPAGRAVPGETSVLDSTLLLSTVLAEREREMVKVARERALRSGPRQARPRQARRVNPFRRATGRLLLRAGMWMIGPATAAWH